MTVYQDQIWVRSRCREFEQQTYQALRSFENAIVKIQLVDSAPVSNGIIHVTDNIMPVDHVALYPEFWGGYSYEPTYEHRLPTRLFNCFINRICPNRQSWFYQLVKHDLISKGHVSFRVDASRTPYSKYPDAVSANDAVFLVCNHLFKEQHDQMRHKVPFSNFTGDLDQIIVDSKISLVLETYHDNPNISFSEKTFRALQLPRPFVIFAYPGTISVLRGFGFDVWDDLVDNHYDTVVDPREREKKILDEVKKFAKIRYAEPDLVVFEEKARHNRFLLQRLRSQWPDRLKSVIEVLKNKYMSRPIAGHEARSAGHKRRKT